MERNEKKLETLILKKESTILDYINSVNCIPETQMPEPMTLENQQGLIEVQHAYVVPNTEE